MPYLRDTSTREIVALVLDPDASLRARNAAVRELRARGWEGNVVSDARLYASTRTVDLASGLARDRK